MMGWFVKGMPLEGWTQSNGQPNTMYSYTVETWGRTARSTHVRIKCWVRMRYYNSFFSYAIGHQCTVNGVYQSATIKSGRKFWGQYADWGLNGSWAGDRDGTMWHGPYTVFDADVPIGTDDENLTICPMIVRPWTGSFEDNEITNWEGRYGQGYYASRPCPQDGAFMNNKDGMYTVTWHEGAYPRPATPSQVKAEPPKIEIIQAATQPVAASWNRCNGAKGYDLFVYRGDSVPSGARNPDTVAQHAKFVRAVEGIGSTSASVQPSSFFDIKTGDKLFFGIRTYDGQAWSKQVAWSDAVSYFEIPSYGPTQLWCIGRRGTRNEVLCAGETVRFYYSGWEDGSYPVARYELVGSVDGLVRSWKASDARSEQAGIKSVEVALKRQRPRTSQTFTLRSYDAKGRAVHMRNGADVQAVVDYYGGLIWRYDVPNGARWHQGLASVYVNGKWRESEAVYVFARGKWRTL